VDHPRLLWQLQRDATSSDCPAGSYWAREMYVYQGLTALCGRQGAGHCLLVRRGELATPEEFLDGEADYVEDGLPNRGAALHRFRALADRALARS